MIDTTELLLVDGPGAGQRVRHHSDWATYMHVSYPDMGLPVLNFDAFETTTFAGPTYTPYRIGHAYGLDRQIVRVGWCSGEPEPDREELEYWLRYEPPVKVISDAGARPGQCDFATRTDAANTTIQGVCRCGWETEAVPRRRTREVLEWVDAHAKVSRALIARMDSIACDTRSIREATRYQACLSRAEAVGMSRKRAEAVFRDEEFRSYGFDEAIDRLEGQLRRMAMYGYLPLTARDVLTQRQIEAHKINPEAILNRPRWMPAPLGQQFAEMSRDRQRSLVTAALAVTAELGGDAQGWPLERAMAAVMPFQEDARV